MDNFYQKVIEPLQAKKAGITLRTQYAYNDIIRLGEIAEHIELSIEKEHSTEGGFIDTHGIAQLTTLLKALYVFVDIFVNIFLQELTGNKGITLIRCLQNNFLSNLALQEILPVYSIIIYRNKVIVHHDEQRTSMHLAPANDLKSYRFFPQSIELQHDQDQTVVSLWEKYASSMLERPVNGPSMLRDELRILFINIPLTLCPNIKDGKLEVCGDRKTINEIAEAGGCPSMTRPELLRAIDEFSLNVAIHWQ